MYSKTLIIAATIAAYAFAQSAYDTDTELSTPSEEYAEDVVDEAPAAIEDDTTSLNETVSEVESPANETLASNQTGSANSTGSGDSEEENSGVKMTSGVLAASAAMAAVAALLI